MGAHDIPHMARAALFREIGGPEVLQVGEVEVASPTGSGVLVKVAAAGVNFMDVYHRRGDYETQLPSVPGIEGAGTVVDVGEAVADLKPGTRVAFTRPIVNPGAYAELSLVHRDAVVELPDEVGFEQAAAVMIQGMSAHYLSHDSYAIQPGDTVLVHAAAGGLGLLLVQLAKSLGARVIGTVSSEAKAAAAMDAGADEVINYSHEDIAARVGALTDGGVHAVYDGVGRATFDASLAALRPKGTLVVYGTPSGDLPLLDTWRIWEKSLRFTRTQIKHHTSPAEVRWRSRELFEAITRGDLDIRIDSSYPIEEAAAAQSRLESRKSIGKILILP